MLKVLCVDDEAEILRVYENFLAWEPEPGQAKIIVETVQSPVEALEAIKLKGPYAVIVSDFKMPKMTGVEFLRQAQQLAPDTVRIMITGCGDLNVAVDALNEAFIFRFLTKPCAHAPFIKTIDAGIQQYRLITAEKELLEKTLGGAVKAMTEVLGLVNPTAFGRALRVQQLVQQLGAKLQAESAWQLDVAALLCQVGCVTVAEDTLRKLYAGEKLNKEEAAMVANHPRIGHDLIAHIPRLEPIAAIIAHQESRFEGGHLPNQTAGSAIPLGARLLKVALDFDFLISQNISRADAIKQMSQRAGWYDPAALDALSHVVTTEDPLKTVELSLGELLALTEESTAKPPTENAITGLLNGVQPVVVVLAEDVLTKDGRLLLSRGNELTPRLLERLRNCARHTRIREPIRLFVPQVGSSVG